MRNKFLGLSKSIFKENDIRGKYPQEINEETAFTLGKSFALVLQKIYKKPIKIIVGYDNRKSSPTLANFLILGIKSSLLPKSLIINLQQTTTPLFYFSMKKSKAEAGVMITASHNPFSENGFLFYLKEGVSFLSGKKWDKKFLELAFKVYNKERINKQSLISEIKIQKVKFLNFREEYLDYLKKFLLLKKPLKFVLDDGGGSAGLVLNDFKRKTKNKFLKIILIKGKKYRFSNPFEYRKLTRLKKEIIKRKADGGAAFDSDADRVVFLDGRGRIIEAGKIFSFLIKNFLKQNKRAKFITTEFLNQKLKDYIKKLGARLIYSPTGYGYFYLQMRKNKAFFGSEHSGHYYFKDFYYHDDGLLTLIYVLNFLSAEKKTFSEVMKEFEINPYFWKNFKTFLPRSVKIVKLLEKLAYKYKKPTFENLKLETKNWLMIWRISGTSNLLRVYWEKLGN